MYKFLNILLFLGANRNKTICAKKLQKNIIKNQNRASNFIEFIEKLHRKTVLKT